MIRIADEMNMPREDVHKIIMDFFSFKGMLEKLRRDTTLKIKYFGTFFYYKKTIEKIIERRKQVDEYNRRTKQREYWRRMHPPKVSP